MTTSAIFLAKVSDYEEFTYYFVNEYQLKKLRNKIIARMEKDCRRYVKYERHLRRAIISGRYSMERLEDLKYKVEQMRWEIENEYGTPGEQSLIQITNHPEGAKERWDLAKRSAIAVKRRDEYMRICAENSRKREDLIRRGEADYSDFCPYCSHFFEEEDLTRWEGDDCVEVIAHCPVCQNKVEWEES